LSNFKLSAVQGYLHSDTYAFCRTKLWWKNWTIEGQGQRVGSMVECICFDKRKRDLHPDYHL